METVASQPPKEAIQLLNLKEVTDATSQQAQTFGTVLVSIFTRVESSRGVKLAKIGLDLRNNSSIFFYETNWNIQ